MPREAYVVREHAVRGYLDRKGYRYRVPRYYGDKPDFGDMDVIIASRPDWDVVRAEIVHDLGITQTKVVGRVFSTEDDGLQTDFFAVPEPYVDSTYDFMSFNDLGNLLGRICRRFNLKWGEAGLAYVYRRANSDHYAADLPITQDFAQVCAFLGLDHAAWIAGFPTLISLFDWVITSPYFSVVPYLDDEIAGTMAKRVKERPTIVRFIEYLRERGVSARPAFADKTSYVELIDAAFPAADLAAQIAGEHARAAQAAEVANKFSGKIVMRLRPELAGSAIGEFIMAFKRSVAPDGGFEAFVIATPREDIERRILAFEI